MKILILTVMMNSNQNSYMLKNTTIGWQKNILNLNQNFHKSQQSNQILDLVKYSKSFHIFLKYFLWSTTSQ